MCLLLPWNPLLLPVAGRYFMSNIFCLYFSYLLPRKNFEYCPLELLLRMSLCFFLPFSANISMVSFFDLAEATRCSLNFLPKKFLSCHCNKSASSLSIALDCYPGQLRTTKILYLLKYLIKLLFCPNKSTVFSLYALKLSKSVNIWFSFDLHAFSTYIRNFDRGPITQVFFYLCFSNVTSMSKSFCLHLSFKMSRTKSSNFSTWSRLSDTRFSINICRFRSVSFT